MSGDDPVAEPAARPRERLFFALWPDDECRAALARLARSRAPRKGARPVPAENLHLTLAFLGAVDAQFRRCAEGAADALDAEPFELVFERTGHFAKAGVLWTAPAETPPALAGLASSLLARLVACGHRLERRAFSAHVTLARKVRSRLPESPHPPVRWRVDAFHLVRSRTDRDRARYEIVRSWALG